MKYPEGKMSLEASMPISVQSWFGHELEIRGIDAVVYTRYIISLLKQDRVELDPGEVDGDHLWSRKYDLRRIRGKKSEKKKGLGVSEEDRKKNAAVECLTAISDEATDIEELIEELFARLKEINAQKENQEPHTDPSNQGSGQEGSNTASTSEDPAERYYAAFPALQGRGSQAQVSPSSQSATSIWSKNPITSQQAESLQDPPDDASEPCGHCGSDEAKRMSQKTLSNKGGNNSQKKSPTNRKANHVKTNKPGHSCQPKFKKEKEKGLNRAARLLSWPPDIPKKPENRRITSVHVHANQSKAKSVSPVRHENPKNDGFCPRGTSSASHRRGLKLSLGPHSRRNCGFVSPVSPEFKEQESWYTQPIDGILSSTPDTKGRLFNRHSLSLSDRFSCGLPSSVESSPPDSPNAFQQASIDDVWQTYDDDQHFSTGFPELNLPAFFMATSNTDQLLMPQTQFNCLEQETWSFPFPEVLPEDQLISSSLKENVMISGTSGRIRAGTTTTSDICPLDDPNPEQVTDLTDPLKTDVTTEIHVNPLLFLDPLEEKPCSQSSPSQYKAWGSLPLETEQFGANMTGSYAPSPAGSWSTQKDVDCPFKETGSPADGQHQDLANDNCLQFYSLSQISTPDPMKPVGEDTVLYIDDEFNCFLSESSISLFGDLMSKPQTVPDQGTCKFLEESDCWSFTAPKKQGVFSGALFTDLSSPLFSEDVLLFSSPWYGGYSLDDTMLQKVWDTQHHLTCKASPLSSTSTWLGVAGMEPSNESSTFEENIVEKVWNSHQTNCMASPLDASWLGAIPQDLPQPYIPLLSLWLGGEEEPVVNINISVEESCPPQDADHNDTQLMFEHGKGIWKHPRSASLENLSTTLWETGNLENTTQLSKSFELVPSEHSAFEDVVPRKLSHVLSEPNIKYCQTSPSLISYGWGGENEAEDEAGTESQEHLFFSPKTHFRPIQTPDDQTHVQSPGEGADLHLKDLFGGHLATSKTPYQSYVGAENLEASFIPKFRVKKNSGKYVQTGHSIERANSVEKEDEEQMQEIVDEKLNIVFEVLGDLGEISPGDIGADWGDPCRSTASDTAPGDFSEGLEEWNLRSLWSDNSELEVAKKECKSQPSTPSKAYSVSIWSSGKEMEIPPVPKVGSFEVDQNLYWMPMDSPPCSNENSTDAQQVTGTQEVADIQPSQVQAEDTGFRLEPDLLNWTEFAPLPEQAVYSTELEQKWLNSEDNTDQPCTDTKAKKRRSGKPCSFFLEGHCRRSDCKFAHDMSSITCRFWEDGDCFKGNTCPFLHGYPSFSDDTDSETSSSRKVSSEWTEEVPSFSEPEMPPEKTPKKTSGSKSMKKASFVKKAWSTYWNYRGASKQKEKDEREAIPRKN